MKMTDVSIVTPFYHGNKYIKHLLENIERNALNFNGTLELIIINDSPDDKISNIPSDLHFSLIIINNVSNSGIHKSRINGLKKASGRYIKFLDQDDILSRHCISDQYNMLHSANGDIIVSNAEMENQDHSLSLRYRNKKDLNKIDNLTAYRYLGNQIASPGQCLIKRSCIPEEWVDHPLHNNGADDYFLWLLMLFKNIRFIKDKNVVYKHVYTGKNLSDSRKKMLLSVNEMAAYMMDINYTDKKYIKKLIKSRSYEALYATKPLYKKLFPLIKNFDMSLYVFLSYHGVI